jgi:hypothetical protein
MQKTYAIVKDSTVLNTVVLEEDDSDIFDTIKEIYENPEIIEIPLDKNVEVNYTYNGEYFIDPNYSETSNIEQSSDIPVQLEDLNGITKPN